PMSISRRKVLHFAASFPALSIISSVCKADNYPSRPVRLIVGFQPGTAPDIVGRLIGQRLSDQLGQPVIIENMPGVAGNIAAEFVARAPNDGYTLLEMTSVNSWNVAFYDNLRFDLMRDFAPIASLYRGLGVVVVQPSSPIHDLRELIAYAKANPG